MPGSAIARFVCGARGWTRGQGSHARFEVRRGHADAVANRGADGAVGGLVCPVREGRCGDAKRLEKELHLFVLGDEPFPVGMIEDVVEEHQLPRDQRRAGVRRFGLSRCSSAW